MRQLLRGLSLPGQLQGARAFQVVVVQVAVAVQKYKPCIVVKSTKTMALLSKSPDLLTMVGDEHAGLLEEGRIVMLDLAP